MRRLRRNAIPAPRKGCWTNLPILFAAIALGGHVRAGMEDNVYYEHKKLAKNNAEFVARAARLVREANNEVATPADARGLLAVKPAIARAV